MNDTKHAELVNCLEEAEKTHRAHNPEAIQDVMSCLNDMKPEMPVKYLLAFRQCHEFKHEVDSIMAIIRNREMNNGTTNTRTNSSTS